MRQEKKRKKLIFYSLCHILPSSHIWGSSKNVLKIRLKQSFMPSRPRSASTGMVTSHQQVLLSFCQINYSKRRKETRVSMLDSLLLGEVGRSRLSHCYHISLTFSILPGMKKGSMNPSPAELFCRSPCFTR